jgi:hypothetical protein
MTSDSAAIPPGVRELLHKPGTLAYSGTPLRAGSPQGTWANALDAFASDQARAQAASAGASSTDPEKV